MCSIRLDLDQPQKQSALNKKQVCGHAIVGGIHMNHRESEREEESSI